jgi:uncharacterized protein YecT (DUF1311 family)
MLRSCCVALAGVLTLAAFALSAAARDAEVIDACLKEAYAANSNASSCAGLVSDPCLAQSENQSTHGMVACIERETQVWDGLLNSEYQRLLNVVKGKAKDDIIKTQRQWVALRNSDCAIPDALFEGGTMAQPMAASCIMQNTADRMLQVRAWRQMVQPEDAD